MLLLGKTGVFVLQTRLVFRPVELVLSRALNSLVSFSSEAQI